MSWMDSKLETLSPAEEEARRARQETEQKEQPLPPAWQKLVAAMETYVVRWNQANERTQLYLSKPVAQISLHNAGQRGSILDVYFDQRSSAVKYSAPTRQANHWKRHSGELQIDSDDLFIGSSGTEIARPLSAEETSRFLLEPVLFD